MTPDALVIGAGPAGAIAALVLARAGVRVRLVDRSTFPRDKLCGDTVNPGALAILRRLGISDGIDDQGLPVDGMILTGHGGVAVEGRYPSGVSGRAILRRDLDWALLRHAVRAGVEFEPELAVQRAVLDQRGGKPTVTGIVVGRNSVTNGGTRTLSAPVVIAADGRRSTIAFGLGLARHPPRPRRWAIGAYFERFGPTPSPSLGEMHVRRGRYIGVAAVPGGLTNVCLVRPSGPADVELRDPTSLLMRELTRDSMLRDRVADARLVGPPVVLGPLAVDAVRTPPDGLLLAGDAAGFIDPMTGDGLRFAIRGGELAAAAAMRALSHGWAGVHDRLAADRRREFGGKWHFNRVLRRLVGSALALDAATLTGRVAPRLFEAVIAHAGDCAL